MSHPFCRHKALTLEGITFAIGHWVCKCGWATDATCTDQAAALRTRLHEAEAALRPFSRLSEKGRTWAGDNAHFKQAAAYFAKYHPTESEEK